MKKIEVCFSPALFDFYRNPNTVTVVVDVLRASSAICAAFMNGVSSIVPVGQVEEARKLKNEGFLVAAERDGIVLDFADFGNSPFNFTRERVEGKKIVYSTTNGTQAIKLASSSKMVSVGSFLNLSAITNWVLNSNLNVIILCAGWKNKFSLEDTLLAGAITDQILEQSDYITDCDSALAAQDLWTIARHDLLGYVEKVAQKSRLQKNGLDDVIEFCLTPDLTNIVPVFKNGIITGVLDNISVC